MVTALLILDAIAVVTAFVIALKVIASANEEKAKAFDLARACLASGRIVPLETGPPPPALEAPEKMKTLEDFEADDKAPPRSY